MTAPPPVRRLAPVACVKSKLEHPAPAADSYVSDWARKARAYAQLGPFDDWAILSAKHTAARH